DVTVLLEGKAGGRFIIRVAWRDDKRMSSGPGGNYSLLNRRFGEDESDGRPVAPYYSVGRVMHLEDEHGTLLYQLCLSRPQNERRFAGRPAYDPSVGVARSSPRLLARKPLAQRGQGLQAQLARRGQRALTRILHTNDHMVHVRPVARPDLGELDVPVFAKVGRHRKVLIRNHAVGRNRELLSHR